MIVLKIERYINILKTNSKKLMMKAKYLLMILLLIISLAYIVLSSPDKMKVVRVNINLPEKSVVTRKYVIVLFNVKDKRPVMIINLFKGNNVVMLINETQRYVISAYTIVNKEIYVGWCKIPQGSIQVNITLKQIKIIPRLFIRVVGIENGEMVDCILPGIGVLGKVKVINSAINIPEIPVIILYKKKRTWGIYLPGDEKISLIGIRKELEVAKGFGISEEVMTAFRRERALLEEGFLSMDTIIKLCMVIVISMLIAYISYLTARSYVKRTT